MDTFALPLSFNRGNVTKITDTTDEYYAHLLSCIIRTEPGELPLTPTFGCASPVFGNTEITNLAVTAAKFVPEINVGTVKIISSTSGKSQIQLSFVQV